jgi:hypothetical protein
MTQIFNQLIDFFEDDGWDFQSAEDLSILSMGFAGIHGKWLCYAQAREQEEQFVFYSVLPINVPTNQLAKMAEFLTRVNYGMVIGNFEMDYDDGEIRYKTSVDIEGSELSTALIRQIVYANLVITDRYLPGVMRILYSDDNPHEVLESIEISESLEDFELGDEDDFDDDENGFFPLDSLPPYQSPN